MTSFSDYDELVCRLKMYAEELAQYKDHPLIDISIHDSEGSLEVYAYPRKALDPRRQQGRTMTTADFAKAVAQVSINDAAIAKTWNWKELFDMHGKCES